MGEEMQQWLNELLNNEKKKTTLQLNNVMS